MFYYPQKCTNATIELIITFLFLHQKLGTVIALYISIRETKQN
ncbi:protein of unknown function [Clostridium beijerinckii]|nr:protein of unknown function [Clostridium beijerinckii]